VGFAQGPTFANALTFLDDGLRGGRHIVPAAGVVMHEPEPIQHLTGADASRLLRGMLALAVVVAIAVAGIVGYALGIDAPHTTHLTGRASVDDGTASIRSGGMLYRVPGNVAWIDATGSLHEGGWPACLDPGATTRDLRFGVTDVSVPDGPEFTSVVYVDCRASVP
jgi:hypothetical protein